MCNEEDRVFETKHRPFDCPELLDSTNKVHYCDKVELISGVFGGVPHLPQQNQSHNE